MNYEYFNNQIIQKIQQDEHNAQIKINKMLNINIKNINDIQCFNNKNEEISVFSFYELLKMLKNEWFVPIQETDIDVSGATVPSIENKIDYIVFNKQKIILKS